MANNVPPAVKSALENSCKKAAAKVSKAVPGDENEKKVKELLQKEVCKDVDQKILKLAAEQLAELAKKKSPKDPNPDLSKLKAAPSTKIPSSSVPSLEIPITSIMLDEKLGTTGKFSLKVWADPKDFKKADKGLMLNFTVVSW